MTNSEADSRRLSFVAAWKSGRRPKIEDFLDGVVDASRRDLVTELVCIDLECRLDAGERDSLIEDYLGRFPRELDEPGTAIALIEAEYQWRWLREAGVTRAAYAHRFPKYAVEIESQFIPHISCNACRTIFAVDEQTVAVACPSCGSAVGVRDSAQTLRTAPGETTLPADSRFTILSELGRGGMGVVHKAYDKNLKRTVALKEILPSVSVSIELRKRLEGEGGTLAKVDHPNVVQVYAVEWVEGRPVLVLEYVSGGTLKDRLHGAPLPPKAVARCLEDLARGAHAAHCQKIVHRDLKPANILIKMPTAEDSAPSASDDAWLGRATLKLADFGLAKLLDDTQGQTRTGDVMGTPWYMAPEQAAGRSKDVGPATDVYALGTILYEMLTGRVPFFGGDAIETRKWVLEDEPIPVRKLTPKVPAALETICLKCLQKEPRGRYASAREFAEDLRRFQDDQPIKARPEGPIAQAKRWIRRHKAFSTAAVVVVLLAAVAFAWVNNARQEASRARRAAEANATRARQTIVSYLLLVSENPTLKTHALEPLRRELLRKAVKTLAEFVLERSEDRELRGEQARALLLLGQITGEIESHEDAIQFYCEALEVYRWLADRGVNGLDEDWGAVHVSHADSLAACDRMGEAEAEYLRAIERLSKSVAKSPGPETRKKLAKANGNLAILYKRMKNFADAERRYKESSAVFEQAYKSEPDSVESQLDWSQAQRLTAGFLTDLNRLSEAQRIADAALQLVQNVMDDGKNVQRLQNDLADACSQLAVVHFHLGNLSRARELYEEARDLYIKLANEHPEVVEYLAERAKSHHLLSAAYLELSDIPSARREALLALEIRKQLCARQPDVPQYRFELVSSLSNLAAIHMAAGSTTEVRTTYEDGAQKAKELASAYPRVPEYQAFYALQLYNQGVFLGTLEEDASSETRLREARDEFKKLVEKHPSVPEFRSELANTTNALANVVRKQWRSDEAEPLYDAALAEWSRLVEQEPTSASLAKVASARLNLGVMYYLRLDLDRAKTEFLKSAEIYADLARECPEVLDFRTSQALVQDKLGSLYGKQEEYERSLAYYETGLNLRRALAVRYQNRPQCREDLASSLNNVGAILVRSGRLAEAGCLFWEAQAIWETLARSFPEKVDYRQQVAMGLANLGTLYIGFGSPRDAERFLRSSIEQRADLLERFPDSATLRDNLVSVWTNLGILHKNQRAWAKALDAYQTAATLAEELPAVPAFQHRRANAWKGVGTALQKLERWDESRQAFEKGVAVLEQLVERHPTIAKFQEDAADAYDKWGQALLSEGRLQDAYAPCQRTLALRKEMAARYPNVERYKQLLADAYNLQGAVCSRTGRVAESEQAFHQCLELLESLPASIDSRIARANGLSNLASLYIPAKRFTEAEATLRKALELREALSREQPQNVVLQKDHADAIFNLAFLFSESQNWSQAEEFGRLVVELRRRIVMDHPEDIAAPEALAIAHSVLGDILRASARFTEAESEYGHGAELRRRFVEAHPNAVSVRYQLVGNHLRLVDLHRQVKRWGPAVDEAEKAVVAIEGLLAQSPAYAPAREIYPQVLLNRVELLESASRWADAEAAVLAAPEKIRSLMPFRFCLAHARARQGKHSLAAAVASQLLPVQPRQEVELARIYAVAARAAAQDDSIESDKRKILVGRYSDSSLEHLVQARKSGYFIDPVARQSLKDDPDFALLADRPSFVELTGTSSDRSP